MKEVRCAVLDTSNSIRDPEISKYMRQTTYNFLRNNYSHYRFKIYEENNVDKILLQIRKDPCRRYQVSCCTSMGMYYMMEAIRTSL